MITEPRSSDTVSHYRLLEPLGRGAMGEVWLAEDLQLPRQVAVKLLPRHLVEDPEAVDRLLREAQAAASVDHPAVVTVYEAGLEDGRPYLVMQRVEGETLERRLARGPLPVSEAVELGLTIADALAEVHALGIVHRDLKPANIVLSPHGPKILDFGIASLRGSPKLTTAGAYVGTPLAMSPEQIQGHAPDNRSDLWSLGVMLYQSLTGVPPFDGDTLEAVTYQVLNRVLPAPSTQRPEVGPDLDYLVLKLLRKEPAHRYSRAEDVVADLQNCESDRAPAPRAAGKPTTPLLAVLPFEVLSAEADDAYLAAGLAEDLVVDLTRLGGLNVTTRGETLQYKDRTVPPRTVARELGADFVLLGSVRRAGNRGRISTQLVRAADGHTVWAERFDRTLDDLFDVQAEVSKRIVEALQVTLRPGEREMLDRAPTRSQEAYALYLRARQLLDDSDRATNLRVEELLNQALALDPEFALAHAVLGECYARRALSWWAGLDIADRAVICCQRALALEPNLLEGLIVQAMVQRLRGQPQELLISLERITAMAPTHPEALEWAAWSYLTVNDPDRARELLEPVVHQHPDRMVATMWLATAYEMLGRKDDWKRTDQRQHEIMLEVLRRDPGNLRARMLLASTLIRRGEIQAGVAQAELGIAAAPDDNRIRYNAACAFALAGMPDRALAELREGTRNVASYLADWPRRDPDLVSLHDHPEFIRMFGRAET